MTTSDLEGLIRNWFADEIGETGTAPPTLYAFAEAIPESMPPETGRFGRRTFVLLGAALLLVGLVVGTIAVGSGLMKLPSIVPLPAPSPLALESRGPSTSPTTAPMVFHRASPGDGDGVWVTNGDGTNARELISHGRVIAMSADGSLLGFLSPGGVSLAEVVGPEPRLTNIRDLSISPGFSISPDGKELAFVSGSRDTDEGNGPSVIAIMDLSTGQVVELGSTAVEGPDGWNGVPEWSPDGLRLAFDRRQIGIPTAEQPFHERTIYVVDADGSDLHQLVPTELFGWRPSWSPDGSRILFTSSVEWLGIDQEGNAENGNVESDVYTIRPDGSGLERLTTDTFPRNDYGVPVEWGATAVSWTRDGRIIFTRVPLGDTSQGSPPTPPTELWVMDADGRDQQQLDATDLAELTAAGCIVCPYPLEYETNWPELPWAYWLPAP